MSRTKRHHKSRGRKTRHHRKRGVARGSLSSSLESRNSRHVRFNSPQNVVHQLSIGSDDRASKRDSPVTNALRARLPKCPTRFPCKMGHTTFESRQEWDDFERMLAKKNESVRVSSTIQHYGNIRRQMPVARSKKTQARLEANKKLRETFKDLAKTKKG